MVDGKAAPGAESLTRLGFSIHTTPLIKDLYGWTGDGEAGRETAFSGPVLPPAACDALYI